MILDFEHFQNHVKVLIKHLDEIYLLRYLTSTLYAKYLLRNLSSNCNTSLSKLQCNAVCLRSIKFLKGWWCQHMGENSILERDSDREGVWTLPTLLLPVFRGCFYFWTNWERKLKQPHHHIFFLGWGGVGKQTGGLYFSDVPRGGSVSLLFFFICMHAEKLQELYWTPASWLSAQMILEE